MKGLVMGAVLGVAAVAAGEAPAGAAPAYVYAREGAFAKLEAAAKARGLELVDYHSHLGGGMTPEKAAKRQEWSGVRSGVLENFGREWPLSDDATVSAFIKTCLEARAGGKPMPVGIQVNDRDWHQQLKPDTLARLDYVLADTMIMGVDAEGKPRRLWLPGLEIADAEAWMEEYVAHNLRILEEPVSILANPTYLPECLAGRYDELWTEARMRRVIAKAVEKGVALEVQAESVFPKKRFLLLAKEMGAKFSFGTNNHDDRAKDLTRWLEAIELLDLKPADLWSPKK